jgi:drug/metabolite transporter (DMT)-like permease
MLLGLTMGLLAAVIGALYSVYATYGLARDLKSADMTFLRTSVAGIVTLPVLVYYLRFEVEALTGQWRRWRWPAGRPALWRACLYRVQFTP